MAELNNEQEEFAKQITFLRKILNAQKLGEEDHSQTSLLHTSTPIIRSPPSSSSKVSPIKFDKLQCLKFSGSPHDFATFKRNFATMVVTSGGLTETGMFLKQAVPF